jgi:hypothetical protein
MEVDKTKPSLKELLIGFLLYLNQKKLINNHDFDYEAEAKKYILNVGRWRSSIEFHRRPQRILKGSKTNDETWVYHLGRFFLM